MCSGIFLLAIDLPIDICIATAPVCMHACMCQKAALTS